MSETEYRVEQLKVLDRIAVALERMTGLYEQKIVLVKEPHQVEDKPLTTAQAVNLGRQQQQRGGPKNG